MKISLNSLISTLLIATVIGCKSGAKDYGKSDTATSVKVAGAMKNVMLKGELQGTIALDTISDKTGLYGLGPVDYLKGEILIIDGKAYKSTVVSDTTMLIEETFDLRAPFFVYDNKTNWNQVQLPEGLTGLNELETFLDSISEEILKPFIFKLSGMVEEAKIHIQNLPEGSKVSSPQEAHVGQRNYDLIKTEVDIVGFYSREHKGIFTHHDTNMHLHLITRDRKAMGHLDKVQFKKGKMQLFY